MRGTVVFYAGIHFPVIFLMNDERGMFPGNGAFREHDIAGGIPANGIGPKIQRPELSKGGTGNGIEETKDRLVRSGRSIGRSPGHRVIGGLGLAVAIHARDISFVCHKSIV
jgi:hypothetical protein